MAGVDYSGRRCWLWLVVVLQSARLADATLPGSGAVTADGVHVQDDTESNIADRFLTPLDYRDIMGEPSQPWVICLFFVGALALWLLSRAGGGSEQNNHDRAPQAEPQSKTAQL